MSKSFALLLSAGALAISVAACGSSSASSSTGAASSAAASSAATTSSATAASTPGYGAAPSSTSKSAAPASAGATTRLSVAANPTGTLMFTKANLSAKAGTVQITFTNRSPLGHNLTVQQGSGGAVVASTPTFHGGSKTLTMHLKAGHYTYFCSVPGHRQAGMHGTLTVS